MAERWYGVINESDIDSPALLVYPDRIEHNIAVAKEMVGDTSRLRPHIKTHKTREILALQYRAGIEKFKCATIAEADLLGRSGAQDVLLAFPLHGPKIRRFLDLVQRFPATRYAVTVDNHTAAAVLAEAAATAGVVVPVFIDVNIGMNRTGIETGEKAFNLYRLCTKLSGVSVQGIHAYDGHVSECDLEERELICAKNFEPLSAMINRIQCEGFEKPTVIIGGSPSFPVYSKYPDLECSPGTFILWDKSYIDRLPEQKFLPAAVLLTRVVSLPAEDKICVDLGYKAVASEHPLTYRVYFLDDPDLVAIGQSEEHLVLATQKDHRYRVGDVLYALPTHVCPTVALYDNLHVVIGKRVVCQWRVIARKR